MAKIDYNAIKQEIKEILQNAVLTGSPKIEIESDALIDMFESVVNIEFVNRVPSLQSLSHGSRQRYDVNIVLYIYSRHLDRNIAIQVRDDLLGDLELLLMQNRTINGLVDTLVLNGGQNMVAYIEEYNSFVAAGEIQLSLDCTIIA